MAREFLAQFHHQSFSVGQQLVFSFQEKKILLLIVKELEGEFLKEMFHTRIHEQKNFSLALGVSDRYSLFHVSYCRVSLHRR